MPANSRLSLRNVLLSLALALAPLSVAGAEPLSVVVSVAPAHSLTAMVAGDRAETVLLVPAGASPHDFALRPSAAQALSDADLVIGVGAGLDGFLDAPIRALGGKARILVLSAAPDVTLLPIRDAAPDPHDDGHEHTEHHADGAPHDAETHAERMADPDHAREHDRAQGGGREHAHEAHHHGAADPHLWLDPANARAWVAAIAAALSDADPEGADAYAANAAAADAQLAELQGRLEARLSPVADRPFAVLHDAFQYLERAYGLTFVGAIAGVDGASPSPRRLRAIQAAIRASGAVCVFAEPQFDPGLVKVATQGASAKSAVLDPLGAAFPPGPDQYIAMMDALSAALADCLG